MCSQWKQAAHQRERGQDRGWVNSGLITTPHFLWHEQLLCGGCQGEYIQPGEGEGGRGREGGREGG